MIKDIKKLGEGIYLINEEVKLTIHDEDESVTAEFDPDATSEEHVNELIDTFFGVVINNLAKSKETNLPPGATTEVFEQDECVGVTDAKLEKEMRKNLENS